MGRVSLSAGQSANILADNILSVKQQCVEEKPHESKAHVYFVSCRNHLSDSNFERQLLLRANKRFLYCVTVGMMDSTDCLYYALSDTLIFSCKMLTQNNWKSGISTATKVDDLK